LSRIIVAIPTDALSLSSSERFLQLTESIAKMKLIISNLGGLPQQVTAGEILLGSEYRRRLLNGLIRCGLLLLLMNSAGLTVKANTIVGWQIDGRVPNPLTQAGVVTIGDQIFIYGGYNGKEGTSEAMLYRPGGDIEEKPPVPRALHAYARHEAPVGEPFSWGGMVPEGWLAVIRLLGVSTL